MTKDGQDARGNNDEYDVRADDNPDFSASKSCEAREVEGDEKDRNKQEDPAKQDESTEPQEESRRERQLDDVNANLEMPALPRDLSRGSNDTNVTQSALTSADTAQEIKVVNPTVHKVMPPSDDANKGNRLQEQERNLDGDAKIVPMIHHEKIRCKKSQELEDPHGVQEVLDALPPWYEDSLRANYPTTSAYSVAIKKKRNTTIGNTIFLIFCSLLLLGIVSTFFVYFTHALAGSEPQTNPPAGAPQGAPNGVESSTIGVETTAPASNGRVLAGYQWIHGDTKNELYIDAHNHIQELVTGNERQITDLTRRSGAAIANGRTLSGFEWQCGNSEQVVYIDAKQHVQQLYASSEGQWDVLDLTRKAQAPLASGTAVAGYDWTQNGSKQVVYIDQRGHIQELASSDNVNWHASDLTALTKAPQANGNVLTAYQWDRQGSKQVDYIDINQHVQELSFTEGSWHVSDLNSLVGAPLASGKTLVSYEWRQTGTSQIGYLDTNNHVQLLSSMNAGNWSLVDLTLLVKAPVANGNTLVGYAWQQGGSNVLYFIDTNNHIQELSDTPGENWQLTDLNPFTPGVPPPNGKVLFGYDWAQHGSKQVVYIDNANTVQELISSIPGKWELSSWKHS